MLMYFQARLDGLPNEVDRLWNELSDAGFSLQTIFPVPVELDFENTNLVKTGYAALFGEWESVSRQWMLKECAEKNGYPFPLESREQVIECLREIDNGNHYLEPAVRFKNNLEKYGFGSREEWRMKYWGIPDDVGVSFFQRHSGCIELRFAASAFPGVAMKFLTKKYPDLIFDISFQSESGKRSGQFILKDGKKVKN